MVRFRPTYLKDYFWRSRARNIIAWIVELAVVVVLAFVLVYTFGQRVIVSDQAMESTLKEGDKVLVNIADKALKRIQRGDIIAYREAHGGFSSKEELKEVSGIGEASYGKLEDLIAVP